MSAQTRFVCPPRKKNRLPQMIAISWVLFWMAIAVIALIPEARSETTMKIAVLSDSVFIPKERAQTLVDSAERVFHSNGIDINFEMQSFEMVSQSAHSNPSYVLEDVILHKMNTHGDADVYLLLTTRDIFSGGTQYVGYASMGPACSFGSAAMARLLGDTDNDARTIAHEIAHTFGVQHDEGAGFLMSRGNLFSTDTMSTDTIGVISGSYLDCMTEAKPVSVTTQYSAAATEGGAGSLALWFVISLTVLVLLSKAGNRTKG